jgi:hypothetical protein
MDWTSPVIRNHLAKAAGYQSLDEVENLRRQSLQALNKSSPTKLTFPE